MNSRQGGQAMVEFGIIVSVLLVLILGTLQFALIYHAKITLNYAAFETARAGSINNARMWAMELAFARAMAPLYTTPYLDGTTCNSTFVLDGARVDQPGFNLDHVRCARQRVRDMITNQLVRITLVNPSPAAFGDYGPDEIPNDNLMYRTAEVRASGMSIQDANLIKVHTGFCYELIVPLVDRIIWRMVGFAPNNLEPYNFGPPMAGSFAEACVTTTEPGGRPRYAIPIYSEAVMRMQSNAIRDTFCAGQCGTP